MASALDIQSLRNMIDEQVNEAPYTDEYLSGLIDAASGNLRTPAGAIWEQKAAAAANLVNISEAGSSRSLSDIQKNALAMAALYAADDNANDTNTALRPRTREIVRD